MVLTVRQINATKPDTKIVTLSDGQGLELRILPNGKRNMTSLGVYPDVSLAEAREKRADSITRYRSCRVEVGR
ncbi:Arm DNA-binding domain-containing protein [Halomonas sp. SpR8]|uniref:Arm DNA-binding domain-containing protein n=1 Tax=Halomonas sp. SpR8 TaxID=3050463 RepID=UPI0035B203C7